MPPHDGRRARIAHDVAGFLDDGGIGPQQGEGALLGRARGGDWAFNLRLLKRQTQACRGHGEHAGQQERSQPTHNGPAHTIGPRARSANGDTDQAQCDTRSTSAAPKCTTPAGRSTPKRLAAAATAMAATLLSVSD